MLPPRGFEEIAAVCCQAKAKYVAADERDNGARAALNFGHTFAHAIEKYYAYKKYNHGQAVAVGIRLALETGEKLGVTPGKVREDVLRVADKAKLDTALAVPPAELVPHMKGDKKSLSGKLRLVLIEEIGKPVLYEMSFDELKNALDGIR